jgi:hypothetical protein
MLITLSACSPGDEVPPAKAQESPTDPTPESTVEADRTSDPDFSKIPELKEAIDEATKKEEEKNGGLEGRSLSIPTGGPRNPLDEEGSPPSKKNPGAVFSAAEYKRISKLSNADFIALRRKVLAGSAGKAVKASFYSNGCTLVPNLLLTEKDWQACAQHDFRYTVGPNTIKEPKERLADEIDADVDLENNSEYFLLRKSQPFFTVLRRAGLSNYFATPTAGDEVNDISTEINSNVSA